MSTLKAYYLIQVTRIVIRFVQERDLDEKMEQVGLVLYTHTDFSSTSNFYMWIPPFKRTSPFLLYILYISKKNAV